MTAEGVFPKVAGDVAYASEANRFASSPYTVGSLFTTGSFTSGTNYTTLGSFLIPAANVSNPLRIYIDGTYARLTGAGSISYSYVLSGTTTTFPAMTVTPQGTSLSQFNTKFFLGSPYIGSTTSTFWTVNGLNIEAYSSLTDLGANGSSFNPNIPMVVFLKGNASNNTTYGQFNFVKCKVENNL